MMAVGIGLEGFSGWVVGGKGFCDASWGDAGTGRLRHWRLWTCPAK